MTETSKTARIQEKLSRVYLYTHRGFSFHHFHVIEDLRIHERCPREFEIERLERVGLGRFDEETADQDFARKSVLLNEI